MAASGFKHVPDLNFSHCIDVLVKNLPDQLFQLILFAKS